MSFKEQIMSKDTSVHIFEAKWKLLCLLSFKYFFTRPHFGRPFFKAFKCQRNSVSAQNIISLFKVLSFIHFNNLLGIKTKHANVNRKVLKLGNISLGISSVSIYTLSDLGYSSNLIGSISRANAALFTRYRVDNALSHKTKQNGRHKLAFR